jgi:hypothetical protein
VLIGVGVDKLLVLLLVVIFVRDCNVIVVFRARRHCGTEEDCGLTLAVCRNRPPRGGGPLTFLFFLNDPCVVGRIVEARVEPIGGQMAVVVIEQRPGVSVQKLEAIRAAEWVTEPVGPLLDSVRRGEPVVGAQGG